MHNKVKHSLNMALIQTNCYLSFFFLTVLFCRMRRFSLISSLLCLDSIIVRINGVRLYKEK